jgi:hypothetical protein
MIVIEHEKNLVAVTAYGEFTLSDYKEFEDLVNYKVQFEGKVDLLFDLRQMADYTVDVVWEELKFSRAHAHDFDRIAVVTDDQWVAWSAWLSQIFVETEAAVFAELDDARAWLGIETIGTN